MSQTTQRDPDLVGLVRDYFSETFTPEDVADVERDGPSKRLWRSVEELGLPLVGIDEDSGGSGGSLLDLLTVMEGAGRYAVALPLAETSLGAWLLASAGAEVPAGPLSVVPVTGDLILAGGQLTGTAAHVPWVRGAARIVAVMPDASSRLQVVSINPEHVEITAGADLAGMPRDTIRAIDVRVDSYPAGIDPDELLLRGALLRSAQMAGAIFQQLDGFRLQIGEEMDLRNEARALAHFRRLQDEFGLRHIAVPEPYPSLSGRNVLTWG